MDSPINQGSACGQAPMSPQTPTDSNAYQVNVNRTKTKKWVEAKVQSYDGDDWGADEYEDDECEPMLAPPMPKPATHATRSRESSLPSPQTQPSIVSPVPSGHPRDRRSPDRISLTYGAKDTHLQPVVTTPSEQTAATGHNNADSVVRSSDILGRTEEGNGMEAKSSDMSAPRLISNAAHLRSDSMGKDENFNAASRPETIEQDGEGAGDTRRLSTSPKLPDLARMSAFGTDLFSPGGSNLPPNKSVVENARGDSLHSPSNKPEVVASSYNNENVATAGQQPLAAKSMDKAKDAVQRRTSEIEPGTAGVVSPAPAPTVVKSGTPILTPKSPNSLSKDNVPDLHTDSDIQTIAPLRTPSPRAPARLAPGNCLSETEAIPSRKDASTEQAKSDHEVSTALGSITRQATFDTVASSPAKDNDMLSDEILKSLSPPATPAGSFNRQPSSHDSQSSGHTGPRDSNYTLKGHEGCWEGSETNTKSFDTLANIQSIPDVPDKRDASTSQSITSPTEQPTEPLVSPQSSTLRRQFSWEAEEQAVQAQAQAQHQSAPLAASSTAPAVKSIEGSRQSLTAVNDQSMGGSDDSVVRTSRAIGVSPQVSAGSSQPPVPLKPVLELPSPVTPASDTDPTSSRAFNRLSLAGSPPENHPALVEQHSPSPVSWTPTSQQPQSQIMSFREIMNLGSSEERIAKYNELREIFATTDSGLENWLVHLRAEHPDMGLNGPLFGAQGSQQVAPGSNAPTQAGANNPLSQQPYYYQQYLNASSPNTAASPTSRSRLAGLPIPSHPAGSAFGHSGNQIGNKSKELMHSAGKMGKGLLSKGRSKLRGTGDKGEAVPPSDEPKVTKADWRMSWGLGRGRGRGRGLGFKSMSRGDGEAPQQQQAEVGAPPDMAEWRSSAPDAGSAQSVTALRHATPPSQSQSGHPSRATAGLSRLVIPHSASSVFAASQSAPLPSLSYSQNSRAAGHDSWDVNVSANEDGSKPRARGAAARFPIDDDDDDDEHERAVQANVSGMVPDTATSPQNPPHPWCSSQQPTIITVAGIRGRDVIAPTAFTQQGKDAALASHSEVAPDSPPRDAGRPGHQPGPPEVPFGFHNGQEVQAHAQVQVPVTQTQKPQQVLHPSQRLPISGPWKLEESQLTEPLNPVSRNRLETGSSPPQIMYGFDKETGLTSSDLPAEPQPRQAANQPQAQSRQQQQQQHVQHPVHQPLQQPAQRHASDTMAPSSLRQRWDVPPSSAQRWPELFAHPAGQRSRWSARNGPRPGDAPCQPWLAASAESILPRCRTNEFSIAGVGPPDEELGRRSRNSGPFQDLGQRIARATSRERRGSNSNLNLAQAQDQPTTAQTFSEARYTTPEKHRFPGLTKVSKVVIRRNKHEDRPVSSEQLSRPERLEPPLAALFRRPERPGTSGSFETGSQHDLAGGGHSERRGRRSSVSDLISRVLGKRSGSRTGQGDPTDPGQPSPRQQQSNLQSHFADAAAAVQTRRRPGPGQHQPPFSPSSTPSTRSDMRPTPNKVRPAASSNHGSNPASRLGEPQQRPGQQAQQSSAPADGELIRPSTVSPDVSIASGWTAADGPTEHQVRHDGTKKPMSDVTGGQGAAHADGHRTRTAAHHATSKSPIDPEPDEYRAILPGPPFSVPTQPSPSPPPPKEERAFAKAADPAGNRQQFGTRPQPASSTGQQHPSSLQQHVPPHHPALHEQAPASQRAEESTGFFTWKGLAKRGLGQRQLGPSPKENKSSSNRIFGALNKRDSKQPDAQIAAPMQTEPEPRYDRVPIPRGYSAVHGEGATAPTAYDVGRRRHAPPHPPASQLSFARPQDSASSFGIVASDDETNLILPTQPPCSSDMNEARQRDDTYDAAAGLNKGKESEGESSKTRAPERKVSQDGLSAKPKTKQAPPSTAEPAAAQEEKIWCDAEDGADCLPRMAAASYPGQEWNPYEDPDYVGHD
ncbi:hypothetical protein EsDP_00004512 [Epichloe bromicola]|uniref:Uncharacterized protein n=1 Tax=Epichloe bromicola TaxID=79588 RepID=A0ABQ0CRX6_9HYPO